MPTAPSCSACLTSARIRVISSGLAGRLHVVTHHAAPDGAVADQQHRVRADAVLLELRALIGERPRRAAVLVDDDGGDALRDEVRRRAAHRIRVAKSAARPRPSSACEWMSMKPGVTNLPGGVDHARGLRVASLPTATMRPFCTATSAGNHGLPVPSMTRPFPISRS